MLCYDCVPVNESDGLKLGFLFDLGCNYPDKEFPETNNISCELENLVSN